MHMQDPKSRGPCAVCQNDVTTDHQREKLKDGRYFHVECMAASTKLPVYVYIYISRIMITTELPIRSSDLFCYLINIL